MKIAHFADVHFRGLARHDEYRRVFSRAFNKLKELSPDVIYVGGDIVHSKTQGITPELIDILTWWFKGLAEIAPVDVILGNHDGLLLNKDRQDAITPVINALNDSRIRLFKKSGVYNAPIDGFTWCVFSPFDVGAWDEVKPVKGSVNIALYHGAVRGSKSDSDFDLEGEVTLDMFEKFDFGMLGDIHRRQFLNDAETIAYCGSTIQQNYGEELEKGFLFWDLKSKNKFTTKFIHLENESPFVTIDWRGSVRSTIDALNSIPSKSRVRFSVTNDLSDVDVRALHDEAVAFKTFSEVVFKSESRENSKIEVEKVSSKQENFRDKSTLKRVIEDHLKDKQTDEEKITAALTEFDKYYDDVVMDDDVARNVSWSLKNLEFENVFSYGEKNSINFENLTGITGIFGRNRIGKSSIIGTIVYTLFNTSDRGAMKNLHIINTDAESCKSRINLSVSGEDYEITRESTKNYPKKGEVWANTSLSLKKKSTGDIIKDLNDEQRRETEKLVRKLIGTSDDFFYTCLAPQGQMNMFINEKSTSRKQILSRFLDLEIFDKYLESVKQDLGPLKANLKNAASIDILQQSVKELEAEKKILEEKSASITKDLDEQRSILSKMSSQDIGEIVTDEDLEKAAERVEKIDKEISDLESVLKELSEKIASYEEKIQKIEDVRNAFSIEDLVKQQNALVDLEMKYAINVKDLEAKDKDLEKARRNIEILSSVPCGDSYPTCVFIKDAHNSKKILEIESIARETIHRTIEILKNKINDINENDIKGKIDKINRLIDLEKDLASKKNNANVQIEITKERIANKAETRENLYRKLQDLTTKKKIQDNTDTQQKVNFLSDIKKKIALLEKQSLSIASDIGRNAEKCSNANIQVQNLKNTLSKYEILTLLEGAFSKKGIPQTIIARSLPQINNEITKILGSIAGFTVEIECDDSNSIEIYINYGDRRRIIELGSGMEKMISSIAIRVALTNVSSLPKSDMLIIDEGFGVLDESNLEACAQLLQNLKNYFKKIMIISHVDAIKDIVDNVLIIESNSGHARVNYE